MPRATEEIWKITADDPRYPTLLKEIAHPPAILYGRGSLAALARAACSVGIVGTRKATRYGMEAAASFGRAFARRGIAVISGLATGIDGEAHRAALAEGGVTVAVLGSGVDDASLFPAAHRLLASAIAASGGAVVSEHPPGTRPRKEYFPQRNRIIAGLSRGVVVVEAPEKSGALITARFALDQNRDVFAVPGPITSINSAGPHALIKLGAKLAAEPRDVLEELGIPYTEEGGAPEQLDANETAVLALLESPRSTDELKAATKLETAELLAALSLLELKGLVANTGPDTYSKSI